MVVYTLPVGPLGTNCYLLGDRESGLCAIIDPGEDGEKIVDLVKSRGLKPVAILLTHGHYDHYTAVPQVLSAWPGLPVYLHPDELCREGEAAARYACPMLPGLRTYEEGETVAVGALTVHVLETPGHTSGCVTLQVEGALFTGDTLFAGSCGRTDLPRGDMEQMFVSLRRLAALPGDYEVYPGHGESSTLAAQRATNPYVRHALQRG